MRFLFTGDRVWKPFRMASGLAAFTMALGMPNVRASDPPNFLFVLIDDLAFADLSIYGNERLQTPHMDRLAEQGIRFTQFYVQAPICSPTRVGFLTGHYPGRWRIHSFLNHREANAARGMADYLDPKAPSIARHLKQYGYATAHFGKWHMGGGRDVDDAPHPAAYGFDESSVTFEGLGDRLLINDDRLSLQSAELGQGDITWVEKHEITGIRVDQALDFMERHRETPVYVQLWLNDVHAPYRPLPEQVELFADMENPTEARYFAVLAEMDREMGRLFDGLAERGLYWNTVVILTSDNGPRDDMGPDSPGDTGPFRGRKSSLYEGGIRMPLIIRWPVVIPAGTVNDRTVIGGVDFFPTLCRLAGVPLPRRAVGLDGVDMAEAWLGESVERRQPLFWYYPNRPPAHEPENRSPMLAMRAGNWKLLCQPDGSRVELYHLLRDPGESRNEAAEQPQIVERLQPRLLSWFKSLPSADQ